jgi:hypothetical protein
MVEPLRRAMPRPPGTTQPIVSCFIGLRLTCRAPFIGLLMCGIIRWTGMSRLIRLIYNLCEKNHKCILEYVRGNSWRVVRSNSEGMGKVNTIQAGLDGRVSKRTRTREDQQPAARHRTSALPACVPGQARLLHVADWPPVQASRERERQ